MEVVNSKPLETPDPLINHNCLGRLERSITFVVPEIGSGNMMNFLAGPEALLWYALKMHWRCTPEPFQQKNIRSLILRHPLDAQDPALPATYKIHCKPPSNPACDLLTGLVKKPQRLAAWRIVSGTGIFPG